MQLLQNIFCKRLDRLKFVVSLQTERGKIPSSPKKHKKSKNYVRLTKDPVIILTLFSLYEVNESF